MLRIRSENFAQQTYHKVLIVSTETAPCAALGVNVSSDGKGLIDLAAQMVLEILELSDHGRSSFLQPVESFGIALQNLVGLSLADPALVRPAADLVQCAQVGRDVGMAVVGTDHQVIFRAEL
jgi:hypothetical protein